MKTNQIIVASLLGITTCSSLVLASVYTYADNDTAVDEVEITVPVACTMTGTIDTNHTATLTPGTYSGTSTDYANGIGKTTLTTFCNDNNGFSIYAIGFTGDTEGANTLVGANTGATIATKAYESTDTTSNWSMKVTKVTDTTQTYNPNNMTITNSYDSWHAVPDDYAQVAEYKSTTEPATTDTTLGAKIETTYAAYVATNQPADTYTGKVKYVMVHPYNATAPQKPIYMQDVTLEQLDSLMPNEGDSITLFDKRDESDYTVAKIADVYWMTQNLRIQGTISAALSNFEGEDFNVSEYDLKTDGTSGGACIGINGYSNPCSRLPEASEIPTGKTAKQIGAWYNYFATTAGTISGESNSTKATKDICPTNWHLPDYNTGRPLPGSINSLTGSTSLRDSFQPLNGGFYNGGVIMSANGGCWWSSTARNNSDRQFLSYDGYSLYTSNDGRYLGIYIRCVRTAN